MTATCSTNVSKLTGLALTAALALSCSQSETESKDEPAPASAIAFPAVFEASVPRGQPA